MQRPLVLVDAKDLSKGFTEGKMQITEVSGLSSLNHEHPQYTATAYGNALTELYLPFFLFTTLELWDSVLQKRLA